MFATLFGVNFRTPSEGNNIAFTSLWDNYPDSTAPLTSSASHAYLLMAGSTNHMQYIVNGIVKAYIIQMAAADFELIIRKTGVLLSKTFFVDNVACASRRHAFIGCICFRGW
ncbi:MAG: hypothetical protein R2738_01125 [Bacteroides graminisolvens]